MTINDFCTALFMLWLVAFAMFGNGWLMRLEASHPSFLRWLFIGRRPANPGKS